VFLNYCFKNKKVASRKSRASPSREGNDIGITSRGSRAPQVGGGRRGEMEHFSEIPRNIRKV